MSGVLGRLGRDCRLLVCVRLPGGRQRAAAAPAPRAQHPLGRAPSARLQARAASASGAPEGAPAAAAAKVEVFTGPMFAGKTKALLNRITALEEGFLVGCFAYHKLQAAAQAAGDVRVAIFKSSVDTRYSHNRVVTHDGLSRACTPVESLLAALALPQYAAATVVAVDEAQFFPDLAAFCRRATAGPSGRSVLVAGLSRDFRRQPFGQVQEVVALFGEEARVHELAAPCWGRGFDGAGAPLCPHGATETRRLSNMQQQELVGGADVYEAVCTACYEAQPAPAPASRLAGVVTARTMRERVQAALQEVG